MARNAKHIFTWPVRLKVAVTRLGLVLERLTAAFWPAAGLLLLAAALALLDLPLLLPGWLHLALLILSGGVFLLLLWRGLSRFAWPDGATALWRIEGRSGLAHRPLSTSLDQLPPEAADPTARALFALHQRRARALLKQLKVVPPRPVMAGADPRGFVAAGILLLFVGLVIAGPEWRGRLVAAVTPHLSASATALPASLDAWLDPPDYTGIAPLYLSADGAAKPAPEGKAELSVPSGSTLIAQVQGGDDVPVLLLDGAETPFVEAAGGLYKVTLEIRAGERLEIRQDGEVLAAWPLTVIPDNPPTAVFREPPGATERQALAVSYEAADDYGLTDLKLVIHRADDPSAAPLTVELPGSGNRRKTVQGETYRDLTDHIWAGLAVEAVLVATDELGQEGRSATERFLMPERIFRHPVARALVELRRRLTLSPEERRPIVGILDQLIDRGEEYGNDSAVALAMSAAAGRLMHDRRPAAVGEVQELLWDTAIYLEEGDLSVFARDLRELQQKLMDALENGASDEEINALIDELEAAMQQYLEALAQEMQKRMEQGMEPMPLPEGAEVIQGSDLQRMLEEMRQLSQSGARERAQEMLQQLQNMLENLSANPMAMMPNDALQQAMKQMQQMENLLRRQQDLLDQSYQESQRNRGSQPQDGEPRRGEQMQGQADAQEQLRRELGEMMRDLAEQFGDLPPELGRAEQAMRGARDSLQQGDAEGAIPSQNEAVDQLQQGLSDMVEQMVQQLGPQPGRGQGRMGVRPGQSLDPLDRRSGDGSLDAVDRIDIPDAGQLGRAREILEELRRRRNDPGRPEIERDYLDRLLQQF